MPIASPAPLPVSECTLSRNWLPITGNCGERRVQQLVLQVGVALQHEAEDRHKQQQQREQRQEPVVGDQRGEVGALIVGELVDDGDGEAQPAVPALVEAIEAAITDERRRMDARMASERSWSEDTWRRRFRDHPIGGH